MEQRPTFTEELRSAVDSVSQCFGPWGRDVFVQTKQGQTLLTNRGGVVLRSTAAAKGRGISAVVSAAAAREDFSTTFLMATYALCVIIQRLQHRASAVRTLQDLIVSFDRSFAVPRECVRCGFSSHMQTMIATSGLAGKVNSDLMHTVVSAASELAGDLTTGCRAQDFAVARFSSALKVAHHTVVIKGTARKIVESSGEKYGNTQRLCAASH